MPCFFNKEISDLYHVERRVGLKEKSVNMKNEKWVSLQRSQLFLFDTANAVYNDGKKLDFMYCPAPMIS